MDLLDLLGLIVVLIALLSFFVYGMFYLLKNLRDTFAFLKQSIDHTQFSRSKLKIGLVTKTSLGEFSIESPPLLKKFREWVRRVPRKEEPYTSKILPKDTKAVITIFLSYRRLDSADVVGRIYDRLVAKLGSQNVFKDVDSIPLGEDFREFIDLKVAKATVVLAVMGPKWMGQKDGGYYKIHDPRDFVHVEVASALKRRKPLIPLLVANATMPNEYALPEDIRQLAYKNGILVRPDPDFNNDIERLLSGISKLANDVSQSRDSRIP